MGGGGVERGRPEAHPPEGHFQNWPGGTGVDFFFQSLGRGGLAGLGLGLGRVGRRDLGLERLVRTALARRARENK